MPLSQAEVPDMLVWYMPNMISMIEDPVSRKSLVCRRHDRTGERHSSPLNTGYDGWRCHEEHPHLGAKERGNKRRQKGHLHHTLNPEMNENGREICITTTKNELNEPSTNITPVNLVYVLLLCKCLALLLKNI